MGDGFGTYIKIDDAIIKEKSIINIGNSYLAFSYDIYLNNQEKKKSKKFLFLKIFNQYKEYEPIILGKDKNVYTIGRSKSSDITIDDNLLSKINCNIVCNDGIWKIQDGTGKGKQSTNGIWLYALEDFELFDGMIFRSNKFNFTCKFY